MSVIGPRPALWNQDVLIAEREKYNANDVKPGLTGWAQINGRDELEIPVKAKLDGEYVEKESLFFDIKCFLGTIGRHYFRCEYGIFRTCPPLSCGLRIAERTYLCDRLSNGRSAA